MADELKRKDRVVTKMSRQGLTEENTTRKTIQNVSSRSDKFVLPESFQQIVESNHDRALHRNYFTENQELQNVSPYYPTEAKFPINPGDVEMINQIISSDGSGSNEHGESRIGESVKSQESKMPVISFPEIKEFESLLQRESDMCSNNKAEENVMDELPKKLLDSKIDKQKTEIRKQKHNYFQFEETEDDGNIAEEEVNKEDSGKKTKRLKEEQKSSLIFSANGQKSKVLNDKDEKREDRLRYRRKEVKEDSEEEKRLFFAGEKRDEKKLLGYRNTIRNRLLRKEIDNLEDKQEKELDFGAKNAYELNRSAVKYGNLIASNRRIKKLQYSEFYNELQIEGKRQLSQKLQSQSKMQFEKKERLQNNRKTQRCTTEADKRNRKKEYQKKKNSQKARENILESEEKEAFISKAKKATAVVLKAIKDFFVAISGGVLLLFAIAIFIVFIVIYLLTQLLTGAGTAYSGIYEATYSDISDCEAYYRELETDMEEKIAHIQEEYPDCYEYIYNIGEIGHKAIDLISYLAVKYPDLTLLKGEDELKSLFEEMYILTVEIVQEPRERGMRDDDGNLVYDAEGNLVKEIFMAKICYITLEVKSWEEIVEGRLTEEEKGRYNVYLLSEGAQQVYGNPLVEEWENKISSRFGYRIHPITMEKTFHAGIDIAVPTGTPLYSSTNGTVTIAQYSETAGNYIVVLMESGYSIKYMHLDSLGVHAGDMVSKGMLIGATGNTGRSTGPHLHLEVRNPDNKPIDPTFIVANGIIPEGE